VEEPVLITPFSLKKVSRGQSKYVIFEEIVFGFTGRHISNRVKVRKPLKHFIRGEADVLRRGCPNPELCFGKAFNPR
jgi:hypothetical protein